MAPVQVTRTMLKEMGASDYLARRITKPIQPIDRVGRAYLYAIHPIIDRVDELSDSPRLRLQTYTTLSSLYRQLETLADTAKPSACERRVSPAEAIAELDTMLETLDAMQVKSQDLASKTERWLQQQEARQTYRDRAAEEFQV